MNQLIWGNGRLILVYKDNLYLDSKIKASGYLALFRDLRDQRLIDTNGVILPQGDFWARAAAESYIKLNSALHFSVLSKNGEIALSSKGTPWKISSDEPNWQRDLLRKVDAYDGTIIETSNSFSEKISSFSFKGYRVKEEPGYYRIDGFEGTFILKDEWLTFFPNGETTAEYEKRLLELRVWFLKIKTDSERLNYIKRVIETEIFNQEDLILDCKNDWVRMKE
jgi:hypothetical protein